VRLTVSLLAALAFCRNLSELVLVDANHHYGLAAAFPKSIDNSEGKDLVVQYEVALSEGLSCGGAYIKVHDCS
jgi:Calreticulin family